MGLIIFWAAVELYLLFSYSVVGYMFWLDRKMLMESTQGSTWIKITAIIIGFALAPVLLIDIFLTRLAALTDMKTTGKQ